MLNRSDHYTYWKTSYRVLDFTPPMQPYYTGRALAQAYKGTIIDTIGTTFNVPRYTQRLYEMAGICPKDADRLTSGPTIANGFRVKMAKGAMAANFAFAYCIVDLPDLELAVRCLAAQRLAVIWHTIHEMDASDDWFTEDWSQHDCWSQIILATALEEMFWEVAEDKWNTINHRGERSSGLEDGIKGKNLAKTIKVNFPEIGKPKGYSWQRKEHTLRALLRGQIIDDFTTLYGDYSYRPPYEAQRTPRYLTEDKPIKGLTVKEGKARQIK